MSPKKIDRKVIKIIQRTVEQRHRSLFVIYGAKSRNQVTFLHHVLKKCRRLNGLKDPSILWCYKKESEFNVHYQRKRLKLLRKHYAVENTFNEENAANHLLLSSDVKFCHYSETDAVLGCTFGMLVIQDFEGTTPNILARTVECVEGGGVVLFLLSNVEHLEDLFSLEMDAHARFATESHPRVAPLFNGRLLLSLASCPDCLVLDDALRIRMSSSPDAQGPPRVARPSAGGEEEEESDPVLRLSRTADQLAALRTLGAILKGEDPAAVVSLTSARGRGKSAVLGLAVAIALRHGYRNVCVSSPHLENVQTLFQFLIRGLEEAGERVEVFRNGPFANVLTLPGQRRPGHVTHCPPADFRRAEGADLVVIDEAAAIPLPLVRRWILPGTPVVMASTVKGYEGTGRSLSLKLMNELRSNEKNGTEQKQSGLRELELLESVRYADSDGVELWLDRLLCLEATPDPFEFPSAPGDCELYSVNRKALFSGDPSAERFLQQLVSLFVSSHYKNSPNDLLMMADAPAHRLFCLLPRGTPHVVCALQVALEGGVSRESFEEGQRQGRRGAGNLIPWIIAQQFQDPTCLSLRGARIVRIATHPSCQRMGFGRRALELLCGSSWPADEAESGAPLLSPVSRVTPPPPLDYVGVSFGLTEQLFRFWKKSGFVPLYIGQTTSDATGEHSCIMLKSLRSGGTLEERHHADFRERFLLLLSSAFRALPCSLALDILRPLPGEQRGPSFQQLTWWVSDRSLSRIRSYCRGQADIPLVLDLMPAMARSYFLGHHLGFPRLPSPQEGALLCLGLQGRAAEDSASELGVDVGQVLGCFRKAVRRILNKLETLCENPSAQRKCREDGSPFQREKRKRPSSDDDV